MWNRIKKSRTVSLAALVKACAGVALLSLATCSSQRDIAEGVQLILNTPALEPTTTFEVRFDQVVAAPEDIGRRATNSPLVITPRLEGSFVWLSRRSGLFTPSEPTALGQAYHFGLRAGLPGRLQRTLRTPPLSVWSALPYDLSRSNAPSEPEIKLQFNAEVSAQTASSYLDFRDASGARVPAKVSQADLGDYFNQNSGGPGENSPLTWRQQFYEAMAKTAQRGSPPHRRNESGDDSIPNRLNVSPAEPLPVGKGWRLVVAKDIPASDTSARLPEPYEVVIGDVAPFIVAHASAENHLRGGRQICLTFSKKISPDIKSNNWADWVSISPLPTNLSASVEEQGLCFSGDFVLNARYAVEVRPGFPAEESFTLAGYTNRLLEFAPLLPRLYFPAFSTSQLEVGSRRFQLLALNVPKVRLRAKQLDRHTLIHALRGYRSYYSTRRFWEDEESVEPYQGLDFNLIPGKTIFNQTRDSSHPTDQARKVALDWDEILGPGEAGAVFLAAESEAGGPKPPQKLGTQALVQLTDLGLIWKWGWEEATVYLFSHATGKPVPNAAIWLMSEDNEALFESKTDAQGLAKIPFKTSSEPISANLDDEDDDRPLPLSRRSFHSESRWLMAEAGHDLHAVPLNQGGVPLYGFNIPTDWWSEGREQRRVMLFSDRPVYRPGETVHLKAILRDWQNSHLVVPGRIEGTLRCFDSKGQKFLETNVVSTPLGSWAESVLLPQGPLGHYRVELQLGEKSDNHWFQVQEFQPNAFEISLKTKKSYRSAEKIELPLSARYYMGKSLSRAKVRWSLEAWDCGFAPEGFGDFTFGTSVQSGLGRDSSSFALQGEGMLTNKTNFIIAPEMTFNPQAPQPRLARMLVEVTDLNQQTVSRGVDFTCSSSDFYLGLKRFKAVVREGEPVPLELVAVRSDGSPHPETIQARLTFQHVEWRTVRVQGAGRSPRYDSEPIVTNILEQDLSSQPLQRVDDKWEVLPSATRPVTLVAPEAGLYVIEVRAKDASGRDVVTAVTLTVSGKNELAWNYRNEAQLDLVPDQKSYLAGDTATVLVKAPFSGTALVTVERERVLRSFITELTGNAPAIRVPLEINDAPNVFVSVALVRGSADSPKKFKSPEYRLGYCQLNVPSPESKLDLSIKCDAPDYRPGDRVHLLAEAKDFTGQPVPGVEVTLYAVDEGILSLTGYPTPDPYSFFYETRPLSVRCGISLPSLLPEDPEKLDFHNKGYLIGGGGHSERLRKNFLPCAFWDATLQTGSNGQVEASFVAPDSLTRYRVIAIAHSARSQFGSNQTSFQINKPLMIEPALPQFANVTDRLLARAVVHNQTDQPGEVEVTLRLDDTARGVASNPGGEGSATLIRTIALAARASSPVEFPVEFTAPGTATWIWKARFQDQIRNPKSEIRNNAENANKQTSQTNTAIDVRFSDHASRFTPHAPFFTDSVQSTLSVGHVTPLLREIYLSRTEAGETNLLTGINPQLLEGRGTVTVNVSNTRLSELGEAISQLLHYPYGCVEQASSSLLPWLVLRHLPTVIPQLNRSPAEIDSAIQSGLKRLLSMQTESGGLSYWPGGNEPMLWGSAYGGMMLALASRQGLPVSQASLDRLLNYLSQQLRHSAEVQSGGPLSERCLALYTLALAGRSEAAYQELVFGKRDQLSAESRALLALAILESKGPAAMAEELLKSGGSKAAQEDDYFGCGSRDLAVRLLAWTRHQPKASAVDVLVEELMKGQSKAHWGTTQGNAWALYALAEYANRVESQVKSAAGAITFGDRSAPFQLADKAATFESPFPFTPALGSKPLVLANPSRRLLFTNVKLETRPATAQQSRIDRGYLVQRTYTRLDDDGLEHDLKQLRVGDSVLISLRIEVRQPAHYVAIDDALPSILEAINPEFKSRETRNRGAGFQPASSGFGSGAGQSELSSDRFSDFRELRTDRALFFRDHLAPGTYTIRYLARVRAAGAATAPATKVEEMYHPERFGLSETVQLSSLPLE